MSTLLPLLTGPERENSGGKVLPLCREVEWDLQNNCPVWRRGSPKIVTGAAAVKAWAVNTLYTKRYSKDIFTTDYGNDLMELAGQAFSEAVKQSEAVRYIKECLMINPYITDVRQIQVDFHDSTLTITAAIDTIYGEVKLNGAY